MVEAGSDISFDSRNQISNTKDAPPPPLGFPDYLPYFKRYIDSKWCYHSSAVATATIIDVQDKFAFQIDIWSLIEQRWLDWDENPYRGEETPNEPVGDIWSFHFNVPITIIEGKRTDYINLYHTQDKTICLSCDGAGIRTCSSCDGAGHIDCNVCKRSGTQANGEKCSNCDGRGITQCSSCGTTGKQNCSRCDTVGWLLRWAVIRVKWFTIHSVLYEQNSTLPEKRIRKAPKTDFCTRDIPWSTDYTLDNYSDLFKYIQQYSPIQFQNHITEEYQKKHLSKADRSDRKMVKLSCSISQIPVKEILYTTGNHINKADPKKGYIFQYCQYGIDKDGFPLIYEKDYPLNCCG
ncbi:unnamed protein product, partial [Didymodactylos carnosus]